MAKVTGIFRQSPPHIAHVLLVMHRDDDGACGKKQKGLEEAMREEMENAERVTADA